MLKGQEEQGKAAEEKKSASVPTSNFKDQSGAKFDDNVDDSDAAMAKLNAELKAGRGHEEVAKSKEDADVTKKEEQKKSDENENGDALDPASEAILNEIASIKEAESKKSEGQTPEQKIAELERKNKELYNENKSFKSEPDSGQQRDEKPVLYENMNPEQKRVYEDWVDKEFQMTVPEFQKQLKFNHSFNAEYINPQFSGINKKFSDSDLKKQLGDNKLYNALKNEVDELVKSDTRLKNLPQADAISLATDVVQKNNMPKILKAVAERESARAKLNKRVIINDTTTATPKGKEKKGGIVLDNEAKDAMSRFDLNESDVERYGGKNLVLK